MSNITITKDELAEIAAELSAQAEVAADRMTSNIVDIYDADGLRLARIEYAPDVDEIVVRVGELDA